MSEKADLDKEAVKAAVEKKGLKIGSVEKVTRQKAQRELRYGFSKPST